MLSAVGYADITDSHEGFIVVDVGGEPGLDFLFCEHLHHCILPCYVVVAMPVSIVLGHDSIVGFF